jgi:SAM-dependent methyltransferase
VTDRSVIGAGLRSHEDRQLACSDATFAAGSRSHVLSDDPLVRYLVRWRLLEAVRRLRAGAPDLSASSPVLVLCAGEGLEGTVLADAGFNDITVSDLSPRGVDAALDRDGRLRGLVLNAEDTELPDRSYDLVVVQDGLHHLRRPASGFTEMLRLARRGALFLEGHDVWAGRTFGREWERNGDAVNYVFRWNRALVDQIAKSYLGPEGFANLSFSFWHHNIHLERLGRAAGGRDRGLRVVKAVKGVLDTAAPAAGNQFCGLVLKGR